MLTVYCYSRCTTCQKALKWLDEKGMESIPPEFDSLMYAVVKRK